MPLVTATRRKSSLDFALSETANNDVEDDGA
jgi:hypothetical protein